MLDGLLHTVSTRPCYSFLLLLLSLLSACVTLVWHLFVCHSRPWFIGIDLVLTLNSVTLCSINILWPDYYLFILASSHVSSSVCVSLFLSLSLSLLSLPNTLMHVLSSFYLDSIVYSGAIGLEIRSLELRSKCTKPVPKLIKSFIPLVYTVTDWAISTALKWKWFFKWLTQIPENLYAPQTNNSY